ncbi:hypothetical protein CTI12_AA370770 [Artemisia annua]|uniref:Uncharacterized protein n=1 Tax=Artemisia annua TaxID=35608 RepID=A0A2U1MKB2_ARTAN|nr:hypothetical protein CTI12_AA370770 [Artemisia annua]
MEQKTTGNDILGNMNKKTLGEMFVGVDNQRGGFEVQMKIVEGMESSTDGIMGNHMVADKPLVEKLVKNGKNGNEVLNRECDVGGIKKEEGFEDDKKSNWAD